MTAPLRVVLADDAPLFRVLLSGWLEQHGCTIVGQVGEADGLLAAVRAGAPDLAIVDIRMPPTHRLEGLTASIRLRRDHPKVGVLLLSSYLEATHLVDLVGDAATGVGYLLKERVTGPHFLDAVQRIAAGGCAFDPEVITAMLNGRRRRDQLDRLTVREREVLGLMAEGMTNPAIAARLLLTPKTVETHVRSIFQRLDFAVEADQDRRVLAVLAYLRSG